jgi:hypothetical protein
MKLFLFVVLLLSLSGCTSIQYTAETVPLYQEKYIVIEREDSKTVSVGGRIMTFEQFKDNVAVICQASGSTDFLLGLKTEFKMGDLLNLLPAIQPLSGQAYFLNSKNEIKEINFL